MPKTKTITRIVTVTGGDVQTGAQIKAAYEGEADTNAFDDKSKMASFTAQGTGLLDFDGFAINADTTKFDLGAGSGWVVDNTTDPLAPVVTEVSWSAATAITVTNIATVNITYIAINSSGNVVQFSAPLDDDDRRDHIFLGNIGHPDNATVTTVFAFPAVAASPAAQLHDLLEAIGPFNRKGNLYSADSADLNLHRSAGEVFALGVNYDIDPKKPHSRSTSAGAPIASMLYVFQDGTNSAATAIDPNNYDVNSVITSVPVNKFTVQRIFMFRGGFTNILYGQHVYNSLAEAREGAEVDIPIIPQVVKDSAIAMGIIVIKEGVVDLQDTSEVYIRNFSPFGGTSGGSQANGTLQGTYDNSATPEILTDATRGALSLRRGSALDADNVIEILNGASTEVAAITGDGDLSISGAFTGALTSATGLPIIAGTTGTLTVARGGTGATTATAARVNLGVVIPIIGAASDETTALTAGVSKLTYRMPYAFTLTDVRASVTTAPTGSVLTVDVNEDGVSVLSTKLTIDVSQKTSTTAAIPRVISDSTLADDAEITIDIDTVGVSIAGAGLKVYLIGTIN